ncbi:MAG: hypothetical protein A3I05_04315 [Deltaproteobacteria bacterium RIFCSPLOWO2_02_FULL_44_10]|nr:MAG: hypothetical protein A3C46_07130 [Deltaproteobacteria bacterium RIFCSPHIGHO2_02_FULL_44_16]OGQ46588.1 MAG: hypothetical protein A3I05_04315 [Deltaproteobacteria bacterium RIFCSPLOWO2_02_FULL_44_10]
MSEYPRPRREDESDFFCRFTFGQFFALLLLEVFTLFFIFYLGARYGRQFLGFETASLSDQEKRNEAEIKTTQDPEITKMAKILIEQAQTPELKERIAKMLGTDQTGKVVTEEAPSVKNSAPQTKDESKTTTLAEEASTPPPFEESTTPEKGAASPQGVVRVKSAEAAKYSVQVGSYSELSEANAAIDRWKGKGYAAYMMIADIPDRGRWYRVRIGGFESRENAEHYMEEIRTREGVEPLIVLNEQ